LFNIQHLTTEHLVQIVLWLAIGVLSVDFVMVLFILMRRLSRRRYFDRKDAARKKFSGPVERFLAGQLQAGELAPAVQNGRSRPARDALQELLMGHMTAENRAALTAVFYRLGLVDVWAGEAFGKRRARELVEHIVNGKPLPPSPKRGFAGIRRTRLFSVTRSQAVAQLGQLEPRFAHVFINEALEDPSAYVGRANIAAMGRNREAFEVTVLLEALRQSLLGASQLPVFPVKTALVRYPVTQLPQFVQFLDDPNPRFRFLVVDSIREICDSATAPLQLEDFPASLASWFLNKGPIDESIDVRARSARVIRHFHNAQAAAALRALLEDPNEFVRLHAVRACADPYYSDLLSDTVRRVSDDKWRVREASVKTLGAGEPGRQQLAKYFLDTTDRYASEQIAEEMQRRGTIAAMLPALGAENAHSSEAMNVCVKLVRMGKASLLTDLLASETESGRWGQGIPATDPQQARARLFDILLAAPTPQLIATMQTIAGRKDDQLSARAQTLLESGSFQAALPPPRSRAAAAAGGDRKHA
jgi:HEAT repeat protein